MTGIELIIFLSLAGVFCGSVIVVIAALVYVWGRMQGPLPQQTANPFPAQRPGPSEGPAAAPSQQAPPAAGIAWLEGIGGAAMGNRIPLQTSETLLGRSRVSDVQLQDPKISRQHTLIRLYKGRYFAQDMQSTRGTWVNGQRIETQALQDGDEIQVGDTMFRFRLPQY